MATFVILSLVVLMILGVPVLVALGAPALVYLMLKGIPLELAPQRYYGTLDNSVLIAVPMFLFAGRLMNMLGVTERIFGFAMALVGHIRGGLGHVVVIASTIFSAMSGSAAADAVGVGTITVKAARERGYPPEFAAAITLAASTLAPIIPPSIIMIVYGAAAGVSIGKLFVGGVVPGLMFAAALLVSVSIIARQKNFPRAAAFSASVLWTSFKDAFLVLMTPVMIIGGIFGGFFTPTEAATVAVLYVLALGCYYRTATWAAIYREAVVTGSTVGALLVVVGISGIDAWVFTREQLPAQFGGLITSMTSDPTMATLIILGVVLILGMVMDATPIILMMVPIVQPVINQLGIDPVQFGVLFCIVCVIGLITPPVGVALYGVATVSKLPMEKVFWACLPFFLALIGGIIFFVYFPGAIVWLPNLIIAD